LSREKKCNELKERNFYWDQSSNCLRTEVAWTPSLFKVNLKKSFWNKWNITSKIMFRNGSNYLLFVKRREEKIEVSAVPICNCQHSSNHISSRLLLSTAPSLPKNIPLGHHDNLSSSKYILFIFCGRIIKSDFCVNAVYNKLSLWAQHLIRFH
jgi:hypothetical protein